MSMPAKLSDTRIKNTKPTDKPNKLTDGGGLYLQINPNGSRLWRYRYRLNGKENVFAIGEYGGAPAGETPEAKSMRNSARILTLAEARVAQAEARKLVKAGQNPATARAENKRQASSVRATTFEGVAKEWLARAGVKWKKETCRQRERLLEADIYPEIGKRPISELKRIELNSAILKLEKRAPQMAVIARQLLQSIFDHAEHTGAVTESVALRLVNLEIPKAVHARQLKSIEIGPFLRTCESYSGSFEVRAAMQLAWLTVGRSMEVIEAEWSEFDFEKKLWRIPADRMKKDREHIVPLSKQAIILLTKIRAISGDRKHLFPSRSDRSKPASHGCLWKMIDSIGWRDRLSPHGIRGTASTEMNESQRWTKDVVEAILAHAEDDKTRASYNAAQYLVQRAEALQWWADLLDRKRNETEVDNSSASIP